VKVDNSGLKSENAKTQSSSRLAIKNCERQKPNDLKKKNSQKPYADIESALLTTKF
jgi:hypothetical protein